MNAKEAVAARIEDLCKRNNISINALSNNIGIPPSTIYSMLNEKSQNPGIVTIHHICEGLGVSLREFFDADIFNKLELEDK